MKNLRQKSRLLTVALGVNGLLGSDGVVPYWSSHLDGAESELIVRSGHEVFTKPKCVDIDVLYYSCVRISEGHR